MFKKDESVSGRAEVSSDSMFRSKLLPTLALAMSLSSFGAFAGNAELCENCSSQDAAKSFAKTFANAPQCSDYFDNGYQCSSKNKIVTVVDSGSAKPYRFNVYHEQDYPWNVRADSLSIPSDERFLLTDLARFFKALSEAISDASQGAAMSNNQLGVVVMNNSVTAASSSCPTGTALETLLDPNKLDAIRTVASMEIGTNLLSKVNQYNVAKHKSYHSFNGSVSGSYKGISATINSNQNTRIPAWVKNFGTSERQTSRSDFLAYRVEVIAYDNQGLPVIELTMSDSSQLAGYTLGALKGNSGPLKIENECVKQKFEYSVAQGIFTKQVTAIGDGGIFGPPSDGSGDGSTGGGALFPSCSITDFYQGGRRLYTFRTC
ncbi:hypothetical protein KUL152_17190 [Tenacibaculum sp. KUL152]|nr:hypothetical protein KUL152_17190 [Tenacibaculum sp. KUL152]